jgi:hypothetical protein
MPPWPLQAPRPPCGEVVPSLQVTAPPLELPPVAVLEELAAGAAAGAAAAGAAGAAAAELAEADLSMPPCPLQAPRPPCGDVVPSLQVTGLLELLLAACARVTAGAAPSAAAHSAPQIKPWSLASFMSRSPLMSDYVGQSAEYSIRLAA